MKLCNIIIISLSCVLMVGCSETVQKSQNPYLIEGELVNSYNDIALQNAIISQHTLFPYHFVKNGAEFNELGSRDFGVLVKHFTKNPGPLNIRRGDSPVDLYQARIHLVLDGLKQAGIDTGQITISDGMPGGSGMPSEKVITILEESEEAPSAQTSTTRKTGSR
jgi:hypothetical protein